MLVVRVERVRDEVRYEVLRGELQATAAADRIIAAFDSDS